MTPPDLPRPLPGTLDTLLTLIRQGDWTPKQLTTLGAHAEQLADALRARGQLRPRHRDDLQHIRLALTARGIKCRAEGR